MDPLIKISIIPRGKGLGYTQYKLSDKYLMSKEKIFQTICTLLGGRAAECVHFSDFTTGAADDLERITELAYSYVTTYGMSDSIGQLSYRGRPFERHFSEKMVSKIDDEVNCLVQKAFETAKEILSSK